MYAEYPLSCYHQNMIKLYLNNLLLYPLLSTLKTLVAFSTNPFFYYSTALFIQYLIVFNYSSIDESKITYCLYSIKKLNRSYILI